MILEKQDDIEKVIINTCRCGCGSELHISKHIDFDIPVGYKEYYISLHSSLFEQEQLGIFRLIGRRLKRALYDLIGKNYLYMDIVMNEQEFDEFIGKLQNIRK